MAQGDGDSREDLSSCNRVTPCDGMRRRGVKRIVLCCVVFAMVLALLLTRDPAPTERGRPAGHGVSIRVVEELGGRPLARARVGVTSLGDSFFALTDSNGCASFDMAPGPLALRVGASEFSPRGLSVPFASRATIALSRGPRTVRGTLVAEPGQAVEGRLVFERPRMEVWPAAPSLLRVAVSSDGTFAVSVPSQRAATLELVRHTALGCGGCRLEVPAGAEDVDLGVIELPVRRLVLELLLPSGEPLESGRAIFRPAVAPGRAITRDIEEGGRVRLEVPPNTAGTTAGILDVAVGKRIRGGFPVFHGRSNRLLIHP